MAFNGNGDSKFGRAMASGLLATIAWAVVLVTYCVFRGFGIEDPILGQVFLLLTGLWVGNLTIAQGRKQAATAQTAVDARVTAEATERKVETLIENADVSEKRADAAEARETQWSQHKDHHAEDDG